MTRRHFFRRALAALFFFATILPRAKGNPAASGLTTFLLIRHAEKPEEGAGLAPAGEIRAKAYADYFQALKLGSETLKPDAIYAAADSKNSRRPRLTVEPLAHALGLAVNTDYKDRDFALLANALQSRKSTGRNLLICWHHGAMLELLRALGADPGTLLPAGRWPGEEYDWLIVLRYDAAGHLVDARRIDEGLTGSRPR